MERAEIIIATDTRERVPYAFAGAEVRTLKTGDYSIVGLEDRVTVERKRLEELFTIVGRERARFERELERMARMDYAAIVIEADLSQILKGSAYSKVSPKTVIASLLSWSVRYNVHVFFCGSREQACALTLRLLEKFAKHRGAT